MEVAKWVFPTPLFPIRIILLLFSKKRRLSKSKNCCLFILGWKSKSKSFISFRCGNPATLTIAFVALKFLTSISLDVSSHSASTMLILSSFIFVIYSSIFRLI